MSNSSNSDSFESDTTPEFPAHLFEDDDIDDDINDDEVKKKVVQDVEQPRKQLITDEPLSIIPVEFNLEEIKGELGQDSIIAIDIPEGLFPDRHVYTKQFNAQALWTKIDKQDEPKYKFKKIQDFPKNYENMPEKLLNYANYIDSKLVEKGFFIKQNEMRRYTQNFGDDTKKKKVNSGIATYVHREYPPFKRELNSSYIGFYTMSIRNCEAGCSTKIIYQTPDGLIKSSYLPIDGKLYLVKDCTFLHVSPEMLKINPFEPIIRNLIVCEIEFFDRQWESHCITDPIFSKLASLTDKRLAMGGKRKNGNKSKKRKRSNKRKKGNKSKKRK